MPRAETIATIVREVLAKMDLPASAPATSTPSEAAVSSGRLVTLADVESLAPDSSLEVAPATIITPAARDELKLRRIQIVRGAIVETSVRIEVAVVEEDSNATTADETDSQLVARVVEAVSSGGVGVLVLATRPHRVCCLLNRDSRIEAAVVAPGETSALEESAFQPNVLVAPRFSPSALRRRWRAELQRTRRNREKGTHAHR